jgi:hypothetical protein
MKFKQERQSENVVIFEKYREKKLFLAYLEKKFRHLRV